MNRTHTVEPMNLHLFDGAAAGGDGGASPASGDSGMSETNTTADNAQSAIGRDAAEGGTDNEQDAAADGQGADAPDTDKLRADFESYINGEGKQFFQEKVKAESQKIAQRAINKRFAETKNLEKNAKAIEPMLEALAKQHNVDVKDTQALVQAVLNDKTLYEQKARENGVSVETQMKFDELERQNAMLLQQQQEQEKAEQTQKILNDWNNQAEEFAKTVPGFDFDAAMENDDFYDLMVRGYSVSTAYAAAFPEENEKRIAVQAEKRITDNIRARGIRTNENGTSQNATATQRFDLNKLTGEQLRDFANRAARGENITFR